ncbi:hypothetical protein TRFO_11324 [Tritrichomonas foetus]|uniref:Sperm-tail PG-rich repeat family protein n=1 Tax=Tritrichomonas foetus TaxID=1144522 RepID=A0A1J4J975_9EUKA|nr:hypothetical protein TRFO_11324 [Tritrichomonas foetus]|eukprot:OHS94235.1 hypothetical protein TRFO_11324 [Tritrichomonas foetus]
MSISGRSPRNIIFASNSTDPNVGPGSYEVQSSIKQKSNHPIPFLTSSKTSFLVDGKEATPGPADYDVNIYKVDTCESSSQMRSGVQRKFFDMIQSPSPTKNLIVNWSDKSKTSSIKEPMSTNSHCEIFGKEDHTITATPADYNISPKRNQGITISNNPRYKKVDSQQKSNTPGPGTYDNNNSQTNDKSKIFPSAVFISKTQRSLFHQISVNDNSGLPHNELKKDQQSYAPFGSKSKSVGLWKINKNPGPSEYDIKSFTDHQLYKQKAFGSKSIRETYIINDNPGPAEYTINHKKKLQSKPYSPFLQRSPRIDTSLKSNNEFTSPGQYDIDVYEQAEKQRILGTNSPSILTNPERKSFLLTTYSPSPCMYSINKGEELANSHVIKRRIDGNSRNDNSETYIGMRIPDTPGPGNYEVKNHFASAKCGGYIPRSPRRHTWC